MSIVAWHGIVKMHEAKWTDKDGSTVTFRLPMDKDAENRRNPFQSFTKRRKGKAGTRFEMNCQRVTDSEPELVYASEVMLAGWNDSQTTGHTVKFWLSSDALGHPFEGYDRKLDEFAVSLVELDDDQEPINQNMRRRVEEGARTPSERVSFVAAMMCKDPVFYTWIRSHDPMVGDVQLNREEQCRRYMLQILAIESRAVLDRDPLKAEQFHEWIRKPFVQWREENNL